MKVLLIGGTGTLSIDTTQLCIDRNYEVYLFNRGHNNTLTADNLHYITGNINETENARKLIENYSFDVVVDYLTFDKETLKKRIEVFSGKTKQFIFISSATVYPPQSGRINENCPIGNDGWIYSKKKRICEEYLRGANLPFEFTIVRPYVTYGIKRIPFPIISKKSCWNLVNRIQKGLPILMCGDGNQKITLTHTRDFAVGITGLFLNPKAYGEDFNIAGETTYTWNEVIHIIERHTGKKAKVVYVKTEILANEISSLREEILFDKGRSRSFDNSKLREAVPEFEEKTNLYKGLGETVDFLISDTSVHINDSIFHATEDVLCKKHGGNSKPAFKQYIQYYWYENVFIQKVKKKLKGLNKCHF